VGNIILATATQPSVGGGLIGFILPLALMFAVLYFLMIRPQAKRTKEHQKMLTELKKGDRVLTSAGMIGTIFAIEDEKNKVVLKISDDVKVEFLKSSIASKLES